MIPSHTHILPPFERVDFSQPGGAGYGFATRESRRAVGRPTARRGDLLCKR
jgi:hypothetical protein